MFTGVEKFWKCFCSRTTKFLQSIAIYHDNSVLEYLIDPTNKTVLQVVGNERS